MDKKTMHIIGIAAVILVAVLAAVVFVGDATNDAPKFSEPTNEYDPWNLSITIQKEVPIYTEEESRELLRPVLTEE